MRFNEFQRARKLVKENANAESLLESSIYSFLVEKEEEVLNEGIISAIVGWFKRNFSPRAMKLKALAQDYYKWMLNEFTATYKGSEDETELERFYKTEKVSDDIEDKMLKVAEDDDEYRKLAEALILEYKIRAKKDFASQVLGAGNNLSKTLGDDLNASTKRVNDIMTDLSKEDAAKFKKNLLDLKVYIKKQGKWSEKQATTLASGIMTFSQNRKNTNYVEMTMEDLQKEYDKGESPWFSVNSNMKNDKGIEYVFSIRSLTGNSDLMKKNKLTGKDIQDQVDLIDKDLKSAGIDVSSPKQWGYVELYLKQLSADSRKDVLEKIKKAVEGKTPEEIESGSTQIEKTLDKTDNADTPQEVQEVVDDAEDILNNDSGSGEEEGEEKVDANAVKKAEESLATHRKDVLDPLTADLEKFKAQSTPDEEEIKKTEELLQKAKLQDMKLQYVLAKAKGEEEEMETLKVSIKELSDKLGTSGEEESSSEEGENSENGEKTEEAPKENEFSKSVEDRIKENQKTLLFDPLTDIIITLGSAKADERGKLVFNDAIKAKKTETALKVPVDPEKQGIPANYVENAKKLLKTLNEEDPRKSELNTEEANKAAASILEDIKKIASTEKSSKAIMAMSDEDFKFFVLRLLNDKKLSIEPVAKEKIEEIFEPTIKHYQLA
jgi:hypothetical protein